MTDSGEPGSDVPARAGMSATTRRVRKLFTAGAQTWVSLGQHPHVCGKPGKPGNVLIDGSGTAKITDFGPPAPALSPWSASASPEQGRGGEGGGWGTQRLIGGGFTPDSRFGVSWSIGSVQPWKFVCEWQVTFNEYNRDDRSLHRGCTQHLDCLFDVARQ